MAANIFNSYANLTAMGQFTKLATDLTTIRDTAQSGTGATTGQGASLVRTPMNALPALNPADLLIVGGGLATPPVPNFPDEVRQIIDIFSMGFAASFFNNQAIQNPPNAFLNSIATAKLLLVLLNAYLGKGLPGHDAIGGRII